MTEYRNENEIVMHTVGRSGAHVTKNWIASMFEEPIYCLNNCRTGDPFKVRKTYWRRVKKRPLKKFFVNIPHLKLMSEKEITRLRNVHKLCLLYSYEHKNITETTNGDFVDNSVTDRDLFIGNSRNKYVVLILRDVFNWLASVLLNPRKNNSNRLNQYPEHYMSEKGKDWEKHASVIPIKNYISAKNLIKLWKEYANEFLGKTNYLPKGTIFISFNQWFYDKDYRINIANQLNLKNSDFALDFTGSEGGFDGRKFNFGGARDMKVLERWKFFKDNFIYHEILDSCPEVRELSNKIFGRME